MNAPAKRLPPRATLADVEAVSPHKVAELVDGILHVMSRPAPRHLNAEGAIHGELYAPFQRGRGGPGGWWILTEPELHFADPLVLGDVEVLTPDIAGWTLERMPELPDVGHFDLAPDWICEVLSKSTETFDREEKMPVYAREGVRHAWLVDPIARTLEVYELSGKRSWGTPAMHGGAARIRVPPFEALELDLSALWVPAPRLAR